MYDIPPIGMRPFGGLHQASCRFARHVTAGIALSRRAAGGQHSVNWLQSATTYIQSCCRWQPNFAMSKLNDMSRLAECLACLAGLWCAAGVYAQTSVDVHSHIIVQSMPRWRRLQPACDGLWRPMPCCRLAQGCPSVATPQGFSE